METDCLAAPSVVTVYFGAVERLVERGAMDRRTALRLIELELRTKVLEPEDRAFLERLREVVAR
jgi:hypothetical protein